MWGELFVLFGFNFVVDLAVCLCMLVFVLFCFGLLCGVLGSLPLDC